ncbi:MAG TPA: tetratricopeptide repeat protein [Panacibacter sp.]|nr:tetratricopeptide repeat protein [Panacibacter sp.]
MQDNFTPDVIEQLISYLDGELSPEETVSTEKLLQEDPAVKERFDNLVAARSAIKTEGLRQKISRLHQQYYPEVASAQIAENETAKVIKPSFGNSAKIILRIAAVFIFVVAGYAVYEYSTTSNDSVYADNFIKYQLPVSRGEGQAQQSMDSLFSVNNFRGVIEAFKATANKKQKDYFLAALASLETGDSQSAIDNLKNVQQLNSNSTEKYFEQETDYYLALAYIKASNIDEAEKQLNTIKANKQHMFYQKASEISSTKLGILKMKE